MGAAKIVTDATFTDEVLLSEKPVLVDFWAEWCGPCKMVSPILEEIAAANADKITVAKFNVDENPRIASELGIRSIPTLMVFKGGQRVAVKTGAGPKSELSRWISASV